MGTIVTVPQSCTGYIHDHLSTTNGPWIGVQFLTFPIISSPSSFRPCLDCPEAMIDFHDHKVLQADEGELL